MRRVQVMAGALLVLLGGCGAEQPFFFEQLAGQVGEPEQVAFSAFGYGCEQPENQGCSDLCEWEFSVTGGETYTLSSPGRVLCNGQLLVNGPVALGDRFTFRIHNVTGPFQMVLRAQPFINGQPCAEEVEAGDNLDGELVIEGSWTEGALDCTAIGPQ